jgi:hypothetical protein
MAAEKTSRQNPADRVLRKPNYGKYFASEETRIQVDECSGPDRKSCHGKSAAPPGAHDDGQPPGFMFFRLSGADRKA